MLPTSRHAGIWRAIAVQIVARRIHFQIDVRVVAGVSARMPSADLQNHRFPTASVLEVMPVGVARREPSAVTSHQDLFAAVRDENDLAFEHHQKFIFMTVPVALAGPGARREPEQIDPELSEPSGFAQSPPAPGLARGVERRRISGSVLCR